jgi:glycosyltransferase involved in cell wall biosynthesis/2-polyprenyl-3-methyl-5-hydroxy-6-metoxy-1,4-benzoquinol methylase
VSGNANNLSADKLRVVFYAPGMPFDAGTVATRSLGGSESAAYYMAREMAKHGHAVIVFTSQRDPRSGDGVTYVWHGEQSQAAPLGAQFELYARNTPHDLLVAQRVPHAFHGQFAAKICLWQLHDLALYRTASQILGGSWQIDAVTCVSDWHARQVKEVWNINPDVLRTVPNGVDPELYGGAPVMEVRLGVEGATLGPDAIGLHPHVNPVTGAPHRSLCVPPNKFLLLYQSRPERGLGNALDLLERAASIGLPVHLLVCAYENPVARMEGMYSALYARAAAMPNVTLLGALSKPELAALQKRCDLLLYPTEFEEVSCITAMEAMHAALPMLTSAVGALPETCTGAGVELLPLNDGHADLEAFDRRLQDLFGLVAPGQYPDALNAMRTAQLEAAKRFTWARACERLIEVHAEALRKRQASPAAILRHCVEHSDIAFADWYLNRIYDGASGKLDPIVTKTRDEIDRLYDFATDADRYAAHYKLHQTKYYDSFEDKVIGEDVTQTTRYRGVMQCVRDHIQRTGANYLRVLDYGCAHGHYSIPMAKALPTCDFVGVDISARAVAAAQKWAARDGVGNATFVQGTQASLKITDGETAEDDLVGTFDVIVAGEVLEHVWDYLGLIELLRGRLAPGGCLVFTTPLGRWEHSGTEAFRTGREHLHHFERADIEDICRGHEVSIFHAPAAHDRSGFQMSSYVWIVWPNAGAFSAIDYERKLRQITPRQTVSACLIVKDGERTLRRCLESIVDWVDEIVVSVDASTTDRTQAVLADFAADFPNRPVRVRDGLDAMRDGFAAARNASIDGASGDWILWIDADEELREPWNMHRFLKPSMHNGYGWPQVHYSVNPEQVLTTDYPCRLFRNRIGVKFYGFVHEHPEQELGKAVPWSLVRQEMKFLHHGYFDEETRQARFRRNLPLLMRDVEAYPKERPLNKFLLLRDLAQSIQFEARARGGLTSENAKQAWQGVRLMEEIAEMPQIRMVADAMQYYSLCVASLDVGFDAELSMKTKHPAAPDLAASLNFNGRFHSRSFFERLAAKFTQESIKHYEDPHL